MIIAGITFATSENVAILLFASIVGVVSPAGNEVGPFRAVEEAMISDLADEVGQRAKVFAGYVVAGTAGTALGTLGAGMVVSGLRGKGVGELEAWRLVFWGYAAMGLLKWTFTLGLTESCEGERAVQKATGGVSARGHETTESSHDARGNLHEEAVGGSGHHHHHDPERQPLLSQSHSETSGTSSVKTASGSVNSPSPSSSQNSSLTPPTTVLAHTPSIRRIDLISLVLLFALDSLGSGMVPLSLQTWYLTLTFHSSPSQLGLLMSLASVVSTLSNLLSAPLAARHGPIDVMVSTHFLSSVFLALTSLSPFPDPGPGGGSGGVVGVGAVVWAEACILLRALFASMDQAPRSVFLASMIPSNRRTAVFGLINAGKTVAQACGPAITGLLAGGRRFGLVFPVAGGIRMAYDAGMLLVFRSRQRIQQQ
jgi:MFS family permease